MYECSTQQQRPSILSFLETKASPLVQTPRHMLARNLGPGLLRLGSEPHSFFLFEPHLTSMCHKLFRVLLQPDAERCVSAEHHSCREALRVGTGSQLPDGGGEAPATYLSNPAYAVIVYGCPCVDYRSLARSSVLASPPQSKQGRTKRKPCGRACEYGLCRVCVWKSRSRELLRLILMQACC